MIEAAKEANRTVLCSTDINEQGITTISDGLKRLYALFFDENAFGHQKGEGDEFKKCTLV